MNKITQNLKTLLSIVFLMLFFLLTTVNAVSAQDLSTDEDRSALMEDLLLEIPFETDNPSHTFAFSNPSSDESVWITIDSGEPEEIASPYSLPSLGIGTHTLEFRYYDAQNTETSQEVSIVILPRRPELISPEKIEEGIVLSGTAVPASKLYLFISGEKSNYRQIIEVPASGEWEYIFNEDFDSPFYTVIAYVTKNGYGSEFSEPKVFAIQLKEEDRTLTDEIVERTDKIIFTYSALFNKETWLNYKENSEFIIFVITILFIGLFLGFIIDRIIFGNKERMMEKSFKEVLQGNKENALDRKAKREEKKLLKQKMKEEKKAEKENKKKSKDDKNEKESSESKPKEPTSIKDKLRFKKDGVQETQEENELPQSADSETDDENKTKMEPILDQETENLQEYMAEPAIDANDLDTLPEEELNKTSVNDQEEKRKVSAMHVDLEDDHDENFPVFEKEDDEPEGSTSEDGEVEGEEVVEEEQAEDNKDETADASADVSEDDEPTIGVVESSITEENSEETIENNIDTRTEKPVGSTPEIPKEISKDEFLEQFLVHDPDPEGKDPLEIDPDQELKIPAGGEDESKSPKESKKQPEIPVSSDGEPITATEVETDDDTSKMDAKEQKAKEPLKKTMTEKLVMTIKKEEPEPVEEELNTENQEQESDQTQEEKKQEIQKTPLSETNISTRTISILEGAGLKFLEDVKEKEKEELQEIKGIGEVSLKEITKAKKKATKKATSKKTSSKRKATSRSKSSKTKSKRKRSTPKTARARKNNIPKKLSGGLDDVDW